MDNKPTKKTLKEKWLSIWESIINAFLKFVDNVLTIFHKEIKDEPKEPKKDK